MFRELSSDVTLLELIHEVSSLKYCIHNTCCNFHCLEDAKRKRPHGRKRKVLYWKENNSIIATAQKFTKSRTPIKKDLKNSEMCGTKT